MIHPTAIIDRHARIGEGTTVGPWTIIGAAGEIRDDRREKIGPVDVGENTIIREMVTIHDGASIGDNCYIMAHSHVGHDAFVWDDTTISTAAIIGGHCVLMRGANIGLNATLHQWVIVGAYAMIGAGAVVVDHVPPFCTVAGNPARVIGTNTRGLERARKTQDIPEWWDNQYVDAWQESRRLRNQVYPRGVCKNKGGSVHCLG